ncbi:MAG: transposase [Chitinispirillaceae bacterium]
MQMWEGRDRRWSSGSFGDGGAPRVKMSMISAPIKVWINRSIFMKKRSCNSCDSSLKFCSFVSLLFSFTCCFSIVSEAQQNFKYDSCKTAACINAGLIDTDAKHQITNALGESVNAKIEKAKRMACGFRNRDHYKTAIYFHCGGLDLYPRPATKSNLRWAPA